jgi:putative nucleotidyltransferase with HDIG domain
VTRSRRLVVRTLIATFGAIVLVLVAVFVTVIADTRARVTRSVADSLEAGQRAFATVERRRQGELVAQATTLAESPTLKAALDTYQAELRFASGAAIADLRATIQREIDKLSTRIPGDALVVADAAGRVIASAGRHRAAWHQGSTIELESGFEPVDAVAERAAGPYRVVSVPLLFGEARIGALLVATALDPAYARELKDLSRADIVVLLDGRVITTTLEGEASDAVAGVAATLPEQGIVPIGGRDYAVRRLFKAGDAEFVAATSISDVAAIEHREALQALALIAIGALALSACVSFWLARSLAGPINRLSAELQEMTAARAFDRALPRTGSSDEVDALTDTFNGLMSSLQAAEAQNELAYLGVIKALAAALDARDQYTAGHSERVSALSVAIGERLGLPPEELEVLRLGALLHDIGKIGIRDKVLTKAGPLTREEIEIVKSHPTVGAHILRQVPVLSAHIPIVELHHEQPDGRGYPYGMVGDAIPLHARIVRVADAFDAMTSARAYRPAQSPVYALDELRKYRGSQFDPAVVDAFLDAWAAGPPAGVWPAQAGLESRRPAALLNLERASGE